MQPVTDIDGDVLGYVDDIIKRDDSYSCWRVWKAYGPTKRDLMVSRDTREQAVHDVIARSRLVVPALSWDEV